MKVLIFALACFAVAHAEVDSRNLVNNIVIDILNNHFRRIAEVDPAHRNYAGSWHLPDAPNIFGASGRVDNVYASGFSNLQVNSVAMDRLSDWLNLELVFPRINGAVGHAEGHAYLFSYILSASGSGSITVEGVKAVVNALVTVDGGTITVTDVYVKLSVDNIDANIELNFLQRDLGVYLTRFLNNIPRYFRDYESQVSAVASYLGEWLANRFL